MRLSKIWPAKSGICDCWWSARLNLGSLETKEEVVNTWCRWWTPGAGFIRLLIFFLIAACFWTPGSLENCFFSFPRFSEENPGLQWRRACTLLGNGMNANFKTFQCHVLRFPPGAPSTGTIFRSMIFVFIVVCYPRTLTNLTQSDTGGLGAASTNWSTASWSECRAPSTCARIFFAFCLPCSFVGSLQNMLKTLPNESVIAQELVHNEWISISCSCLV